jgi:hypothetical protein
MNENNDKLLLVLLCTVVLQIVVHVFIHSYCTVSDSIARDESALLHFWSNTVPRNRSMSSVIIATTAQQHSLLTKK